MWQEGDKDSASDLVAVFSRYFSHHHERLYNNNQRSSDILRQVNTGQRNRKPDNPHSAAAIFKYAAARTPKFNYSSHRIFNTMIHQPIKAFKIDTLLNCAWNDAVSLHANVSIVKHKYFHGLATNFTAHAAYRLHLIDGQLSTGLWERLRARRVRSLLHQWTKSGLLVGPQRSRQRDAIGMWFGELSGRRLRLWRIGGIQRTREFSKNCLRVLILNH